MLHSASECWDGRAGCCWAVMPSWCCALRGCEDVAAWWALCPLKRWQRCGTGSRRCRFLPSQQQQCGDLLIDVCLNERLACLNALQVMSEGGPQPRSSVHFSVSNLSVAEVSCLGHVTAKAVGRASIQGSVQVVSEDTGRVTVFSQVSSVCVLYSLFPLSAF